MNWLFFSIWAGKRVGRSKNIENLSWFKVNIVFHTAARRCEIMWEVTFSERFARCQSWLGNLSCTVVMGWTRKTFCSIYDLFDKCDFKSDAVSFQNNYHSSSLIVLLLQLQFMNWNELSVLSSSEPGSLRKQSLLIQLASSAVILFLSLVSSLTKLLYLTNPIKYELKNFFKVQS